MKKNKITEIKISGQINITKIDNLELISSKGLEFKVVGQTLKVFNDDSSTININTGNGNVMNFGKGNVIITGNNVTINGKKVEPTKKDKDKKSIKKIDLSKYNITLDRIILSGQSSIRGIDDSILDNTLTIACSGQSNLELRDTPDFSSITAQTSGQSHIRFNNFFSSSLSLQSSGQSSIRMSSVAYENIDKNTSGQSNIS